MKCGTLFCRCGNNRDFRRAKQMPGSTVSINSIMTPEKASLKVTHAGGRTEVFGNALPASHLMEKYPDMCVARPEIFKNASASILLPDEKMLLGHKYFITPTKTAEKLLFKQQNKVKNRGQAEGGEDTSCPRITWDVSEENMEAAVSSAKDFYYPKLDMERGTRYCYRRNGRVKRPFGPPFPKTRNGPSGGWKPSLTSVQETSP